MADEWDIANEEEMAGGSGGAYLDTPGWYHLLINNIKDGQGPKGEPIEGFTLECEAMAGTVEDCKSKRLDLTFFKPRLTDSEKAQGMAKKKASAFFVAADLLGTDAFGQRKKIEVLDAIGRQVVVEMARQYDKDENGDYTVETKFLRLNYANVFHVDDPEVASVPKDAEALSIIAKDCRHDEAYFAFRARQSNKSPKPAPKPKPDDFSNL